MGTSTNETNTTDTSTADTSTSETSGAQTTSDEIGAAQATSETPNRYGYIVDNLKQLLTNPFGMVADVDQAWVQHAAKELKRTAAFKYEATREARERESLEKAGRERAERNYAQRVADRSIPSNKAVLMELKKFRADRFVLEAEACKLLEKYAKEFLQLEFMAKTQHGQSAWYAAAGLLAELGRVSQEAFDEYTRLLDHLSGLADSQDVHETDYVQCTAFMAKYRGREEKVAAQIENAAMVCADAIEFEAVKSYVVAEVEGSDDDPDKWWERVQGLGTMTADGVDSAAGAVDGQPGTIAKAASAFVSSGTAVVDKILTSARRARRVEKLRKDPQEMDKIVAAMNERPTIMALYLKQKYMDNLEYNLKLVQPLVTGTAIALDVAGFESVPVGSIVAMGWDSLKTAVIELAETIQQERIDKAEENFRKLKNKAQVESVPEKLWESAQKQLEGSLYDKLLSVFEQEKIIENAVSNPASLDVPLLRRGLVKKLTKVLTQRALRKQQVPAGQLFFGDDFVDQKGRFTGIGDEMRARGFGS